MPHMTHSICQDDAYSIIHLFLRDYDDDKIMSFCGGYPFFYRHDRAGCMEREQKGCSQLMFPPIRI